MGAVAVASPPPNAAIAAQPTYTPYNSQSPPPQQQPSTVIGGDESLKASPLTAWAVHLCQLLSWTSLSALPILALPLVPLAEEYCTNTYFDGYGSADCSASAMTACYKDSRCALYHDFFDRDDNFFCSDDSDCHECKCIEANLQNCIIALWVFTAIGIIIELVRVFMACTLSAKRQIGSSGKEFAALSDTFAVRLLQCLNPNLYNAEILEAYWMRQWFEWNALAIVNWVLHYVPCYICAIIIFASGTDAGGLFALFLFGSMVLEVVQIAVKVRYRNGTPYKSKEAQVNVLPTQQQVLGNGAAPQTVSYGQPMQPMQPMTVYGQAQPQQMMPLQVQPVAQYGQGTKQYVRLPNGQLAEIVNAVPMGAPDGGVVSAQPSGQFASAPPYNVSYNNGPPPPAFHEDVDNGGGGEGMAAGGTVGNQWG